MAVLQNFPMVSQLTQVTSDGRPPEDAQFSCVPASIGAGLLWLEGKTGWDTEINPDLLKDAAYGEGWKNDGTAASAYVGFCQSRGVRLYAVNGNPGQLVQEAHKHVQQGHPVVFTEPDPYVSNSLGWSHVCVFYAEEAGYLTAMDPYIARPVRRTDNEWTQLLLFNQIWILEKGEQDVTIDLTMPEVARYFELFDAAGKQWKCRQTGKVVQYAILNYYRTNGAKPLCGLSSLGLPISNEIPVQGVAGAVKQHFERGVLAYDPQHKIDSPPGAGDVYPLHLYVANSPGQDPLIGELEAEVAQLKAQPLAQADPQATQALAIIRQIKPLVTPF